MKNAKAICGASACGITILVSCWLVSGCGAGANSPQGLVDSALNSSNDETTRERAALDLGTYATNPTTLPEVKKGLRTVLEKSDSPKVRAAAAQGLGNLQDWEGMPLLIKSLESTDVAERGRAYWATSLMLRYKVNYDVEDPDPESRKEAIKTIKMYYEFNDKKKKQAADK